MAGETIWFRAYRTDAATHVPTVYSKFVYVELYNLRNERVERLKVMEKDSCFHGGLRLDSYLPSGRYCLRAYTYWMQNFDEAFYFTKEITIENLRNGEVHHQVRWETTESGEDYAMIRYTDGEGRPFVGVFIDCRMYRGQQQVGQDVERTDGEGWVCYPLRKQQGITGLRTQFLDKRPMEYQANFKVPLREGLNDMDLQFMPEGGELVAGLESRVYFKAVGGDGYGLEVFGSVYRGDGELVTGFVAWHPGMGDFVLSPVAGEKYYALLPLPDGGEKRVDLPEVKGEGMVLSTGMSDTTLVYQCRNTPGFLNGRRLFLLVHSRGNLLAVMPVDSLWSGVLPLRLMPPGLVHATVVDQKGEVYSQRLSFVYPREGAVAVVRTDRETYGPRDSVKLEIRLADGLSGGLSGSVVVTDAGLAPPEKWGGNIRNYFLLSSDLRGYVEHPDWYFDPAIPLKHRQRMMDLLLGTQGWTCFDVGRICRGERDSLPFFLELSQGLSGKIRNFWGKDVRNGKLYVIVPKVGLLRKIEVDERGGFDLNVIFPDSSTFIFQALSEKNRKWVEIELKKDSLCPPCGTLFREERRDRGISGPEGTVPGDTGMQAVKTRGFYYEGGKKIYMLEEAKVKKRRTVNTYLERMEQIAEQILEARDIRDEKFRTIEEWIRSIPGVRIEYVNGCRKIVHDRKAVYVFANDLELIVFFPFEDIVEMLNGVDIANVERLAYVKDSPPFLTGMAADTNLLIFVYLKKGYSLYAASKRLDFVHYTPLGYHEPAEFYQPKYEVAEERGNPEPDERPTLYWNPAVRLTAGEPETLMFYTSDGDGPFRVTVEGITDRGEVVRTTMDIKK